MHAPAPYVVPAILLSPSFGHGPSYGSHAYGFDAGFGRGYDPHRGGRRGGHGRRRGHARHGHHQPGWGYHGPQHGHGRNHYRYQPSPLERLVQGAFIVGGYRAGEAIAQRSDSRHAGWFKPLGALAGALMGSWFTR